MTTLRQAAQQALEALEKYDRTGNPVFWDQAEKVLRQALEVEQQAEPVAWQYRMRPDWGSKKDCWCPWKDCTREQAAMYQRVPLLHEWAFESRSLYTHPQPSIDNPCPPFTHVANLKLDELQRKGYAISGYSIYHEDKHQHGFVTAAGLVGWWNSQGDSHPQPKQQPLTDEQIHDCFQHKHRDKLTERRMITRAIEAAHGIK